MRKMILLSSALALFGSSFGIINHPLTNPEIKKIKNNNSDNEQIIDFNALNNKVALAVLQQEFPNQAITQVDNVNVSDLNVFNPKGTIIGTKTTQRPQAIFVGDATLDNSQGNSYQKLKTQPQKKEVTNQITHTVTQGININVKITIQIFGINLDYNYSDSKTETKSTTISIDSPSQTFTVPPHKTLYVKTYLGQNDIQVELKLTASLSGLIQGNYRVANSNINYSFALPLALAYEQYSQNNKLPDGVTVDMENQLVNFCGLATAESVTQNNIFSVVIDEK